MQSLDCSAPPPGSYTETRSSLALVGRPASSFASPRDERLSQSDAVEALGAVPSAVSGHRDDGMIGRQGQHAEQQRSLKHRSHFGRRICSSSFFCSSS